MKKKNVNIAGVSQNLSNSITEDIAAESKKINLPLSDKRIGISVSNSEEYSEMGFSSVHQKDITIELTRYILANGAHLVYGGDLREDGYTAAFSELSFQYRSKYEHDKMHFTNYFGWPIHLKLKNSDDATFKKNRVKIEKVNNPTEVPVKLRNVFIPPDTIENKLYWALSMSKMREKLIADCNARIIVGGQIKGYKGFYPGIIEEAIMTVQAKQPLYVIGAFGGASSFIIRALKGEKTQKLSDELFDEYPSLKDLHKYAKESIGKTIDIKSLFEVFHKLGVSGLSKLNKLSLEQNEILFTSNHFHAMIYNILIGLNKALKK